MRSRRLVRTAEGSEISVILSDEKEFLLEAAAAKKPAIGIGGEGQIPIEACRYAVERIEDIDEDFLRKAAYRYAGLPLEIAQTKRLRIRELTPDDFKIFQKHPLSAKDRYFAGEDLQLFFCEEKFYAYIRWRYDFYDYGIWAILRKEDQALIGIAGFYESEKEDEKGLSYLIFPGERKKGYAYEACSALIEYGKEKLSVSKYLLEIREGNAASLALGKKLKEKYKEALEYRGRGVSA